MEWSCGGSSDILSAQMLWLDHSKKKKKSSVDFDSLTLDVFEGSLGK